MKKLIALAGAGLLLAGVVTFAAEEEKPRTMTLALQGAICPGCASQLAKAIESVEGAKILRAPKKGSGDLGVTLAVVELSGEAKLGALATAIEEAETPHAEKTPPDVVGVIPGKARSTATPEALLEALKKAGLMEE